MSTVLLIDVGNTRIKWRMAGAAGEAFDAAPTTDPTAIERAALPDDVTAIHYCLVAGEAVESTLLSAMRRRWPDVAIHALRSSARCCGIENGYADPARLGADRWAALLGAHALAADAVALVCTFGTATTIDLLVPAPARFVGGLILPGIETMRRSLARDTQLTIEDGAHAAFAVRTEDAIASGILEAQLGAVERALAHATTLTGKKPTLLASGGAAPLLVDALSTRSSVRWVPDLVLRGLERVADER